MSSIVYWFKDNLYLNITNRCSNNCYFCIRNFRDGIADFKLKLKYEPSLHEIIQEIQNVINIRHWKEAVFCGFGEPTKRLDEVLEVAKWIKKYHNKVVRIDTNGHGYLLNPGREVVEELKQAGVSKANVSVNADDKELYNKICKPQFENAFESVLDFVEKSRKVLDTEITFVTVPEVDISKMEELAKKLDVKLRARQCLS
jgi:TatD family-associated radical SAM protein